MASEVNRKLSAPDASRNERTENALRMHDPRLSACFRSKLAKYMGEFEAASPFADRYIRWYMDHSGARADWFRSDLIWRIAKHRPLAGRKVLDFGCGTGSSSVVFAEEGAEVIGLETEWVSIQIASQRATDLGVAHRCSFIRIPYLDGRGASLPLQSGSVDLCALIGVLEHMTPHERTACATEIRRVLKPGGDLFVFDTPNRAYPKDHHTTQLWLVGWMPRWLARRYAILRRRFDRRHDYQRYGGNGISRREIDRLFPASAWSLSYEKADTEIAFEYGRLANQPAGLVPIGNKVRRWCIASASRWLLKLVKFAGCRPTYWTASHAIGFTKREQHGQQRLRTDRSTKAHAASTTAY